MVDNISLISSKVGSSSEQSSNTSSSSATAMLGFLAMLEITSGLVLGKRN